MLGAPTVHMQRHSVRPAAADQRSKFLARQHMREVQRAAWNRQPGTADRNCWQGKKRGHNHSHPGFEKAGRGHSEY